MRPRSHQNQPAIFFSFNPSTKSSEEGSIILRPKVASSVTVVVVSLILPTSWRAPVPSPPCALLGGEDERHDEPVQPEDLGKDEDEDHPDEEARLLRRAAHARVAHDADGEAGCEAGQADAEASAEVHEAPVTETIHF